MVESGDLESLLAAALSKDGEVAEEAKLKLEQFTGLSHKINGVLATNMQSASVPDKAAQKASTARKNSIMPSGQVGQRAGSATSRVVLASSATDGTLMVETSCNAHVFCCCSHSGTLMVETS